MKTYSILIEIVYYKQTFLKIDVHRKNSLYHVAQSMFANRNQVCVTYNVHIP